MTRDTLFYLLALVALFVPPLIRDRFDWSDVTTAKIAIIPSSVLIVLSLVFR